MDDENTRAEPKAFDDVDELHFLDNSQDPSDIILLERLNSVLEEHTNALELARVEAKTNNHELWWIVKLSRKQRNVVLKELPRTAKDDVSKIVHNRVLRATHWYSQGEFVVALTELESLLKNAVVQFFSTLARHVVECMVYCDMGRSEFSRARVYTWLLLENFSSDSDLWRILATVCESDGDNMGAAIAYIASLYVCRDADTWVRLGECLSRFENVPPCVWMCGDKALRLCENRVWMKECADRAMCIVEKHEEYQNEEIGSKKSEWLPPATPFEQWHKSVSLNGDVNVLITLLYRHASPS